jgi:hypothetical protein
MKLFFENKKKNIERKGKEKGEQWEQFFFRKKSVHIYFF